MDSGYLLNSPADSPSKAGIVPTSLNKDYGDSRISPVKKEPFIFSPFKNSGLSPFKLINQSPSKGSYDEWDKDFIASFEENLFGMDESMNSPSAQEDFLKSPVGKALLESRNSPLRIRNVNAVRRLKISPQNKNTTNSFQCLSQSENSGVGTVLVNDFIMKEEDVQNDILYGQTSSSLTSDPLSAIDPNKMGATPIKPCKGHSDNVPKRKLAMKIPEQAQPFQTFVIQNNALSGIQQIQSEWPSKERLKFARLQFQKVLNMAVEREVEILQEERKKKMRSEMKVKEKESRKHEQNKGKTAKPTKGKVMKSKGKGKKVRKEKYSQIKKALSKSSVSKKNSRGKSGNSIEISKQLFAGSSKNYDFGWYPGEYCDENEEDDEDDWCGPVPFNSAKNNSYCYDDTEESSEDEDSNIYRFETQSGRQVTWKKRRLY